MMTSCCSQTGRAHLLLVSTTPGVAGGALGVITLEGKIEPRSVYALLTDPFICEDIIEVSAAFQVDNRDTNADF